MPEPDVQRARDLVAPFVGLGDNELCLLCHCYSADVTALIRALGTALMVPGPSTPEAS